MQSHHAETLMQLQVTLQTLPPVSGANDKNTTQDGHKTTGVLSGWCGQPGMRWAVGMAVLLEGVQQGCLGRPAADGQEKQSGAFQCCQ